MYHSKLLTPLILLVAGLTASCGGGGGNNSPAAGPAPTNNVWTWIGGSKTKNAVANYGTQGVSATTNIPGAREGAASWVDPSGNIWMFGGYGHGLSSLTAGHLADLWKYDPSTGQWVWISGSGDLEALGTYGTKGTADATNKPGARELAVAWTDAAGSLYLFGGVGSDASITWTALNDLWKYDPSANKWTWISGSNTGNAIGSYGTKGVADIANAPGARLGASGWIDTTGNLWLFGGHGRDSGNGYLEKLNDLWMYEVSTGNWTWVSGSDTKSSAGSYGTKGVASTANFPGARSDAAGWKDASDNLWLFGGYGYDSTGRWGHLNDIWKFDRATKAWTWVNGSSTSAMNAGDSSGNYGTQGITADTNMPGPRNHVAIWPGASGTVWMFGGVGLDMSGQIGGLNDLWTYDPATNNWTWISGSSTANAKGSYGQLGVVAAKNSPPARSMIAAWDGGSGNLLLFGGESGATDYSGTTGYLADLWVYKP